MTKQNVLLQEPFWKLGNSSKDEPAGAVWDNPSRIGPSSHREPDLHPSCDQENEVMPEVTAPEKKRFWWLKIRPPPRWGVHN